MNTLTKAIINIDKPYLVIQTSKAPYSTSGAIDSLEAALAASNIGLTVVYIFIGDGVFQLSNQQQNTMISHKSIYKKLTALPLFDVEHIFAQATALQANDISLSDINIDITPLKDLEIAQICAQAQHVLVF